MLLLVVIVITIFATISYGVSEIKSERKAKEKAKELQVITQILNNPPEGIVQIDKGYPTYDYDVGGNIYFGPPDPCPPRPYMMGGVPDICRHRPPDLFRDYMYVLDGQNTKLYGPYYMTNYAKNPSSERAVLFGKKEEADGMHGFILTMYTRKSFGNKLISQYDNEFSLRSLIFGDTFTEEVFPVNTIISDVSFDSGGLRTYKLDDIITGISR